MKWLPMRAPSRVVGAISVVGETFHQHCQQLNIRHIYTKPYTPRSNGGRTLHPHTQGAVVELAGK